MSKQYVVFGLGRFGSSIAMNLEQLGCEVIAIDKREDAVKRVADHVTQAIIGSSDDEELLKSIGLRNLDGAVVAIGDNMESSILTTMLAKEHGCPYVMAKATTEHHKRILEKVGADLVTIPEREIGTRIAKVLATRNFKDWIDLSPDYSMVEVPVPDQWDGKTLKDLNVRVKYGLNVVGMIRDGEVRVNIRPDEPMNGEDIMIVIGENEMLAKFNRGKIK